MRSRKMSPLPNSLELALVGLIGSGGVTGIRRLTGVSDVGLLCCNPGFVGRGRAFRQEREARRSSPRFQHSNVGCTATTGRMMREASPERKEETSDAGTCRRHRMRWCASWHRLPAGVLRDTGWKPVPPKPQPTGSCIRSGQPSGQQPRGPAAMASPGQCRRPEKPARGLGHRDSSGSESLPTAAGTS